MNNDSETYFDNSKESFVNKLFSHKGRFNRKDYFVQNIFLVLISLFSIAPVTFLMRILEGQSVTIDLLLGIIFILFRMCIAYLSYIMIIKRLHDLGISGWFSVLSLLFGPIVWLLLFFVPGTRRDNKYGPFK